jgi:hypothetical protein
MSSLPALALLALLLGLGLPGAATAGAPGEELLAAPGRCAEPRRFQPTGALESAGVDVAGPAAARFAPGDVAAGVATPPVLPTPKPEGFDGRGPCDVPGSGCLGPVAPAPPGRTGPGGNGGVTVVERPPRPSRPPGAGKR